MGIRGIVEAIEHLGYTAIQSTADDDPSRPNAQIESLARTKEIMSWRNTFYNCLICALPVSFISMVLPMIAPAVGDYSLIPGLSLSNLAMLFLTIPIQFRIGKRFHVAAWKVKGGKRCREDDINLTKLLLRKGSLPWIVNNGCTYISGHKYFLLLFLPVSILCHLLGRRRAPSHRLF